MKVVGAFYSFDVDFMNYKYSNLPDTVKYIDQNQEQCDQQSHPRNSKLWPQSHSTPPLISPSRHHLRLDEEADPAGDDEHEAREVDLDQELHLLPLEPHLDPAGRVSSLKTEH